MSSCRKEAPESTYGPPVQLHVVNHHCGAFALGGLHHRPRHVNPVGPFLVALVASGLKHHHESVLLPMRRAKPNGSFESRLCESEHTTQGHLTLSFQWDTMCWKLARSKKRPEVPPGLNASLWCSGSLLSQLEVAATAHFSLGLCPQVAGRRSCTASHAVF